MSTWSDLYNDILAHINKLKNEGCDDLFFRGQSNIRWKLTPSLARTRRSAKEREALESRLYYDFISQSGPLLQNDKSSWYTLFTMQHHGIPTRLLDWTLSFSTALYFAVKHKPQTKTEACVWVLDPYKINSITCNNAVVLTPPDDFEGSYYENFITEEKDFDHDVVAINPIRLNSRQVAQESVFTISGNMVKPIEQIAPGALKCFRVPASAREDAIKFLQLAGVNEFRLFPDLDGLARLINERNL